jgi:hypothetical protein
MKIGNFPYFQNRENNRTLKSEFQKSVVKIGVFPYFLQIVENREISLFQNVEKRL